MVSFPFYILEEIGFAAFALVVGKVVVVVPLSLVSWLLALGSWLLLRELHTTYLRTFIRYLLVACILFAS
jgi:hypothetical protein